MQNPVTADLTPSRRRLRRLLILTTFVWWCIVLCADYWHRPADILNALFLPGVFLYLAAFWLNRRKYCGPLTGPMVSMGFGGTGVHSLITHDYWFAAAWVMLAFWQALDWRQ